MRRLNEKEVKEVTRRPAKVSLIHHFDVKTMLRLVNAVINSKTRVGEQRQLRCNAHGKCDGIANQVEFTLQILPKDHHTECNFHKASIFRPKTISVFMTQRGN